MVTNDEASRQVWLDEKTSALAGLKPGVIAIGTSTFTPAWVRELAVAMTSARIALLDAMVSGSTPQADSGGLVYLVGGGRNVLQRAEPLLNSVGSSIHYAGQSGCGALAKLVTNAFMGVELSTLAEMIGMLRRQGADARQVLDAVSATALWNPYLSRTAQSMLVGDLEAKFPINLLEKDLGYVVKTVSKEDSSSSVRAARSIPRRAMDHNLGDLNITALVKLFDKK